MKNRKKNINKGLIVFSKGERIAVISLLTLIVILLGFSIFRPVIPFRSAERKAFHKLDSLIAVEEAHRKAEAERMTASAAQQPEKTTKSVALASESKKGSPSPSSKPIAASPEAARPAAASSRRPPTLDLNTADSTMLVELPQIGTVMASRIHRYRNRLGGYVTLEQLFEVKGMDTARFETVKPYLVLETTSITKIDVNRDDFKTLLRHPYLEYEQVKSIVNHRERKGLIRDWNQLQGIVGEVNPLLREYVSF